MSTIKTKLNCTEKSILELLELFGQNYLEDFDGTLDCISLAVTCTLKKKKKKKKKNIAFCKLQNDKRIVIRDFLTSGIIKIINFHAYLVR
ncbi:hypothetical protein PUN28_014861 [Cardiocondyla obscurior]|uniref:Uncharacterized protein n=1 Tax=Cardiocondyla obscurior TaxID=286306 RepID=A0AAW2F1U5_9HYME